MNVPSATPPVSGSAVGVTGSGVAKPAAGGGIADLFSALLASLQGSLTNAPVLVAGASASGSGAGGQNGADIGGDGDGVVVGDGDLVADEDAALVAADAAGSSDAQDAVAGVLATASAGAALAATTGAASASTDAAALSADGAEPVPGGASAQAGSANGATAGKSAGVPGSGLSVLQTGAGVATVSPEGAGAAAAVAKDATSEAGQRNNGGAGGAAVIDAALAADTDAAADTPVHANLAKAPPLVPRGMGAVVVEAVRQGHVEAAQVETGQGRTIRQLVQDAITNARAQAESASVVNADGAESTDAAKAPAIAKQAIDTLPELRPGPAGTAAAAKADAPPGIVVALAPAGGDAASPDAVANQARESARSSLPQSVEVHDVGDFTVRSVRYLSGRTEETVTVRLVPRSLGELQVAVRAAADGIEIVLTAANHAARERLESQLVGLRELFAREGMDVKGVSVQAPPSFDLGSQMPSQQQHHQQHAGQSARFNAPAYREPEQNPPEQQQFARSGRPQHDGGLNMLA